MKEFELKQYHIDLLSKGYVVFNDNSYDGSAGLDCKRPYGNSYVVGDVYEVVRGVPWAEDEDDEMDSVTYEEMMRIHRETATALQIILCTKLFVPGTYVKTTSWDAHSWKQKV